MNRLLVTAVVALLAGPASATNWVELPGKTSEMTASVDTDSIRSMDDTAQAWTRIMLTHPGKDGVSKVLTLLAFSCSAQSLGTVQVARYDAAGKTVATARFDNPKFEDATPDSVGYTFTTYVCARRK
jgi:hypothetical protein